MAGKSFWPFPPVSPSQLHRMNTLAEFLRRSLASATGNPIDPEGEGGAREGGGGGGGGSASATPEDSSLIDQLAKSFKFLSSGDLSPYFQTVVNQSASTLRGESFRTIFFLFPNPVDLRSLTVDILFSSCLTPSSSLISLSSISSSSI